MLAPSSQTNPIDLDSPQHTPSPTYDLPLSLHYTNLKKTKTPSPKPSTQIDPEPETTLDIQPIQTVFFSQERLIIPPITNPSEAEQAKLNQIVEDKAVIQFTKQAISEFGKSPLFSETFIPSKPNQSSSSTIEVLSQHLGGELPKLISTLSTQTAYETIT